MCVFFHLHLVHGLVPTRYSKIFITKKKRGRGKKGRYEGRKGRKEGGKRENVN